jgi:RHS repeat-associated protein
MIFAIRCSGLLLALVFAGVLAAQTPSPTGLPPFGSFAVSQNEAVNLQNGNVHLTIPIVSKPGRGLPINFSLSYDSLVLREFGGWSFVNPPGAGVMPLDTYGWNFSPGGLMGGSSAGIVSECYTEVYGGYEITGWVVEEYYAYIDAQKTNHAFPGPVYEEYGTCGSAVSGTPGTAQDGSGYTMAQPSSADGPFTITDRHGTKYVFSSTGNYYSPVITDSNGNQISMNYDTGVYTDTLGKTALTVAGSGTTSSPITLTYTSPSGSPAAYTIKYTSYTFKTNFGCSGELEGGPLATTLISEIDLPDQSTVPSDRYTFNYEPTQGYAGDITGRLASVTFPTGGAISYTYGGANGGIQCYSPNLLQGNDPATLERYTPDTGSAYWSYAIPPLNTYTTTTTVTDPQGNQTVVNYTNTGTYEGERQIYQGSSTSGTLLETLYTCYVGLAPPCSNYQQSGFGLWQQTIFTTLYKSPGSGMENEVNLNYDKEDGGVYTNGLLEEKDEYDYGNGAPGSLLRKTLTSYASLSNNIIDSPYQVSVYDGSSNLKAQTTYTYDGGSVVSSGITTQHVSVTGSRGNPTTIARLISGSTTSNQTLTYFDTGKVNVAYDADNNPTTTTYSSTYVGAYPTTIENALGQTVTETYDVNTGVLLTSTDPNNLTTSYTYDSMLRPLTVTYPDTGQTTFTYPSPNEETISQKIDASHNRIAAQLVDGLGRPIQQIVSNGEATPNDQTDTCYDSLGRMAFASYPYQGSGLSSSPCPSSKPGDSFGYDPLSRTTTVTHSDNSVFSISYSGNTLTTTDEQGKTRQETNDGAGRLTQVIENPAGLQYTTTYTHDPLDDLTGVTQAGSRQRTFVYDGLSRLTSSTNPEANWSPTNQSYVATAYTYDANSNLTNKTEPAPNQQGTATVTLTFCYDALNRLTAKGYTSQTCTNGTMPSPIAIYSFDQSACLGQPTCYNVGYPTGMSDPAGTESWAYDPMGRVITDQRTTNSLTKSILYQNNLLGSVTSLQYPSGRTVTFAYNVGNRPVSATDSATSVNYFNAVHYSAAGAPCWTVYGGAITGARTFNGRIQPLGSQSTASNLTFSSCSGLGQTGNLLDLTFGFDYGSGDNGNVMGIANNRDTTRSQSFSYDALNRLLAANASTYATSPSHCWGEAYVYDNNATGGAWGNLTNINSAGSAYTGCTQESLGVTATAQNQITNGTTYAYDTAGNMVTNSGLTYVYDAENHLTSAAGVTYTYDGYGERLEKSSGKIYWRGADGSVLDETDLTGSTTNSNFKENVFFNGQLTERRDSSNDAFYFFADHLGTSRTIAEVPSGQTTATLCYDADFYPFGGERAYTTTCSPIYKFTGHERDSESNLDNLGARFASSVIGRFLSPDPYNYGAEPTAPQSWNMYSYVSNNPLAFVDPYGLECVWDDGSYDSNDDPDTGSLTQCNAQGGSWMDHSYFEENDLPDWSPDPNQDIADLAWGPADTTVTVHATSVLQQIASAICSVVPQGEVASGGITLGAFGAVGGTANLVTNNNTGLTTFSWTGSLGGGVNSAASPAVSAGYIYSSSKFSNSDFSGKFTTWSGSFGPGGYVSKGNGVTVAGVSVGKSPIKLPNGGKSVSITTPQSSNSVVNTILSVAALTQGVVLSNMAAHMACGL